MPRTKPSRFTLDETRAAQWLARSMTANDGLNGEPFPDRPGYVTGNCGHAVAQSEWNAGLEECERCPKTEAWADVEMLEIGNDYEPWKNPEWTDNYLLIRVAQEVGAIVDAQRPAWPDLMYEFADDSDGGTYRFLFDSGGPVLASGAEEINKLGRGYQGDGRDWYDCQGLDAAMAVLREAVAVGNQLDGQLDGYVSGQSLRYFPRRALRKVRGR